MNSLVDKLLFGLSLAMAALAVQGAVLFHNRSMRLSTLIGLDHAKRAKYLAVSRNFVRALKLTLLLSPLPIGILFYFLVRLEANLVLFVLSLALYLVNIFEELIYRAYIHKGLSSFAALAPLKSPEDVSGERNRPA